MPLENEIGPVIWVEGGLLQMYVGDWWETYVVLPQDPTIEWTPRTPFSSRPVVDLLQEILDE